MEFQFFLVGITPCMNKGKVCIAARFTIVVLHCCELESGTYAETFGQASPDSERGIATTRPQASTAHVVGRLKSVIVSLKDNMQTVH